MAKNLLMLLMVQVEEVGIMEEPRAENALYVQVEEQAVLATLVAASSRPLPLLQQARLALLQAKPPHTTCSMPRTSKALG